MGYPFKKPFSAQTNIQIKQKHIIGLMIPAIIEKKRQNKE